jgi:hypothetical protein
MSDQLVADTSMWQHTTLTKDRYPCPRRDSNPQSQQVIGHRNSPFVTTRTRLKAIKLSITEPLSGVIIQLLWHFLTPQNRRGIWQDCVDEQILCPSYVISSLQSCFIMTSARHVWVPVRCVRESLCYSWQAFAFLWRPSGCQSLRTRRLRVFTHNVLMRKGSCYLI